MNIESIICCSYYQCQVTKFGAKIFFETNKYFEGKLVTLKIIYYLCRQKKIMSQQSGWNLTK